MMTVTPNGSGPHRQKEFFVRILLSNDDGINAVGLRALYAALINDGHTVDVFAPAVEQSAASSRLTIHDPLRIHPVNEGAFCGSAVTGTPADCVMLALYQIPAPDMVISGINAGPNIGIDVLYSGTVAAALEGALHGIPALALSRRLPRKDESDNLDEVAAHGASLVTSLPWAEMRGRVLNVNYPAGSVQDALRKGLRVCPLSPVAWKADFDRRTDTRGNDYYWFALGERRFGDASAEKDCDTGLLQQGYITATPLHHDFTDRTLAASLQKRVNSGA